MAWEDCIVFPAKTEGVLLSGFVPIFTPPKEVEFGFILIQQFEPPIVQQFSVERIPEGSCFAGSEFESARVGM